jgi:DNA-binding CsgD family transcriptional regulator
MILTPREREVLHWIVQGRTNKEIAKLLGVTHSTVQTYAKNIMRVYGVNSRVLLVLAALDEMKRESE